MKANKAHLLTFFALFSGVAAYAVPVARIGTEQYDTLADAIAAASQLTDGVVELTADATVSSILSVSADMTILGSPAYRLDVAPKGGFTIGNGATLTVDGLTATRTSAIPGGSLFTVEGDSALILTNAVSISDVSLKADSAVVWVKAGALAMSDGVVISGCKTGAATTGARAVYINKGMFEFLGGSILNCESNSEGAGVYCGKDALLRLGGSATVRGNTTGTAANDIYLAQGAPLPRVVSQLTGSLGLLASNARVGDVFASVETGVDAEAAASHFFLDAEPQTLVAEASGSNLVWAAASLGPQPVPESDPAAVVKVTDSAGESCYTSLADAFEMAVSSPVEIKLLKSVVTMDEDLVARTDITLNGAGCMIRRVGSPMIAVTNFTLTVTNAVLSGGTSRMIDIYGGALVLNDGTTIQKVTGGGPDMVAPIVVWGGLFVLNGGAKIQHCVNNYERTAGHPLAAGAVVVASKDAPGETYIDGRAIFTGGTVWDCQGSGAGGVYIGERATVDISGNAAIFSNTALDGAPSNLVVHDLSSRATVSGKLRRGQGKIGFLEGVRADSNIIARVTATLSDTDLVSSARTFTHDTNGDIGIPVRSGGETLFVWGSSVSADGFCWVDGVEYEAVSSGNKLAVAKPTPVLGLVYSGAPQFGVADALSCEAVGNVATNAGNYTATVRLRPGYVWADGTTGDVTLAWSIAKATYDMSGVTFADREFPCNGSTPRSILVAGKLPAGVTVSYVGNGCVGPGVFPVQATFIGDATNYEAIEPMTASMYIGVPSGTDPDPEPTPVVCEPFAFTAIVEAEDGSWKLTLAPGTAYCTYTLYTSDDLKNWTVVGEPLLLMPAAPFEFTGTGGERQRFWKVAGEDGVLPNE